MAGPILVMHEIVTKISPTVTSKFYCFLNPNTYADIGSIVGITKVTDETLLNSTTNSIAELIHSGVLFRLNVVTKGKPKKYFHILCARDKLGTALDGVVGKNVNGKVVGAAKGKAKASFH